MSYKEDAQQFVNAPPYRCDEYAGRNWGHSWHSLCSYHGKLKPAIAHFLVKNFTQAGDHVLDPLCGVGTIPFEACLQGRIGIGNDLSEMAYIVTKAKIEPAPKEAVLQEISKLNEYVINNKNNYSGDEYSDFGFNGKIPTYFHPETYKEILATREYFLSIMPEINSAQAMVYSASLHILHGNRPYALSRNSHPLTPYAPTGDFVYKNVCQKILDKVTINYKHIDLAKVNNGIAINGNYLELSTHNLKADVIICSPPFADSFRFYIQNWMRLWLCGWEPADYKKADKIFLDDVQNKNFDVYKSFFEMCNNVLVPNGKVILHLGKTQKVNMATELTQRATEFFDVIYCGDENVTDIEKHGITDKGATTEHQFLFLQKK